MLDKSSVYNVLTEGMYFFSVSCDYDERKNVIREIGLARILHMSLFLLKIMQ